MNKPMFWIGIALIVISAILLIFVEADLGVSPIIFGIIGIVSIGASKYRPMEKKKAKKKNR